MRANDFGIPKDIFVYLQKTEERCNSFGGDDFIVRELSDPSMLLLRRNGKMLRPMLVFLSALAFDKKLDDYIDMAASIELLHIASLVHDDIIDREEERRGGITVNMKYGNELAILAGDALISKSIQLSCRYGEKVMDFISRVSIEMCAGEALDFAFQKNGKTPDVEDYIKIATLKSASLISASGSAVPIYLENGAAAKMREFGRNLGIAFQIKDDIEDFKAGERGRHMPNIVNSLIEYRNMDEYAALAEAGEMNNGYVDKALDMLNGINGEYLGMCAEWIRVAKS